jgi:hypothetical protein
VKREEEERLKRLEEEKKRAESEAKRERLDPKAHMRKLNQENAEHKRKLEAVEPLFKKEASDRPKPPESGAKAFIAQKKAEMKSGKSQQVIESGSHGLFFDFDDCAKERPKTAIGKKSRQELADDFTEDGDDAQKRQRPPIAKRTPLDTGDPEEESTPRVPRPRKGIAASVSDIDEKSMPRFTRPKRERDTEDLEQESRQRFLKPRKGKDESAGESKPGLLTAEELLEDVESDDGPEEDELARPMVRRGLLDADELTESIENDFRALAAEAEKRKGQHRVEVEEEEAYVPDNYVYKGIEIPIAATDRAERLTAAKQFAINGLGPKRFNTLYEFLSNQATFDADEAERERMFKKVLKTEDELAYIPLIEQCLGIESLLAAE